MEKLNAYSARFKATHPPSLSHSYSARKKRKSFWQILGIIGGDVLGGLIGAGAVNAACVIPNPICTFTGFAAGAVSGSLTVDAIQEGEFHRVTGAQLADEAPYDTLFSGRSNSNNSLDCLGEIHNMALDYVMNQSSIRRANNEAVDTFVVYHLIRKALKLVPSNSCTGSLDTTLIANSIITAMMSKPTMVNLHDTTLSSDSSRFVYCITNADPANVDPDARDIYLDYVRNVFQMEFNTDADILEYTKGYEDILIDAEIGKTTKETLKMMFSIQRASFVYWSRALPR